MLKVHNLKIEFKGQKNNFQAVKGINFSVNKNEVLGILGESGSGKTVSVLSVLRLLNQDIADISGSIIFGHKDIYKMNLRELSQVRGKKISIIFQDPFNALDPLQKIKTQFHETIKIYFPDKNKNQRIGLIKEILDKVKLEDTEKVINKYPHQLSGGMLQRIVTAFALLGDPDLIIADEPTSALDVVTQMDIINLFKELKQKNSYSMIFVSHDVSLMGKIADRVLVMYKGFIVETGSYKEIINKPMHPYTKGLINSIIHLNSKPGTVSGIPMKDNIELDKGCVFCDRCLDKLEVCAKSMPEEKEVFGRLIRCHLV
ncbi:ABC transporter ATP-binding protein [bacterium]|nr:ABC transporter ATP-binding protein [bacterium]